jgi:hypothetical protein
MHEEKAVNRGTRNCHFLFHESFDHDLGVMEKECKNEGPKFRKKTHILGG